VGYTGRVPSGLDVWELMLPRVSHSLRVVVCTSVMHLFPWLTQKYQVKRHSKCEKLQSHICDSHTCPCFPGSSLGASGLHSLMVDSMPLVARTASWGWHYMQDRQDNQQYMCQALDSVCFTMPCER
jgi:hypothetical protein